MSGQFKYYISVSGKEYEVKEGYNLHKIINDDGVVTFDLYDDSNKKISFSLNNLNDNERVTASYGGGTANHRFNYIKTKQIRNKSIKNHRNIKV